MSTRKLLMAAVAALVYAGTVGSAAATVNETLCSARRNICESLCLNKSGTFTRHQCFRGCTISYNKCTNPPVIRQ